MNSHRTVKLAFTWSLCFLSFTLQRLAGQPITPADFGGGTSRKTSIRWPRNSGVKSARLRWARIRRRSIWQHSLLYSQQRRFDRMPRRRWQLHWNQLHRFGKHGHQPWGSGKQSRPVGGAGHLEWHHRGRFVLRSVQRPFGHGSSQRRQVAIRRLAERGWSHLTRPLHRHRGDRRVMAVDDFTTEIPEPQSCLLAAVAFGSVLPFAKFRTTRRP